MTPICISNCHIKQNQPNKSHKTKPKSTPKRVCLIKLPYSLLLLLLHEEEKLTSRIQRFRNATMNIFRFAGDMTHLMSILVLLLKIYATKSCSGYDFSITLHFLLHFSLRILFSAAICRLIENDNFFYMSRLVKN